MNLNDYLLPIKTIEIREHDNEFLKINSNFMPLLIKKNMLSFDSMWNMGTTEIVKNIRERTVERFSFSLDSEGSKQEDKNFFYIKKHTQPLCFWHKIISSYQSCRVKAEGIKEFENYCKFRQRKLTTAIPVAAGVRLTPYCIESFLITKDFTPFIDLEELVLNKPDIFLLDSSSYSIKRRVICTIALYARKMHDAGFNQKDFNATHILLHGFGSDHLEMCLFDLQRVDNNILNRYKWSVKAIAELNYSLPKYLFSNEDRLFLFKSYLRKNNLNLFNKIQWFWIKIKTARIAQHSLKRGLAPKMK